MLLSMTGFGESHAQLDGLAVTVEVRAVNNRYFKLNIRGAEGYACFEPQIEAIVRKHAKRGTINVNYRVHREASADDFRLNEAVLRSYLQQLRDVSSNLGLTETPHWDSLLQLPGVIAERGSESIDVDADWPLLEKVLNEALTRFTQMRREEGRAMGADLANNCQEIAKHLAEVEILAPQVVENYRTRITERLGKLLEEFEVTHDQASVIREVGVFADRTDISEEIVRLRSHLDQYAKIMEQEESAGRKLEFLTQEMFRETNTIGSKANDSEIARRVVEMKTCIERIREQIQNVE
ncbi:MAG: YicC/YloC family endoribonuclease [Blastopirellula sp. JB062]